MGKSRSRLASENAGHRLRACSRVLRKVAQESSGWTVQ